MVKVVTKGIFPPTFSPKRSRNDDVLRGFTVFTKLKCGIFDLTLCIPVL